MRRVIVCLLVGLQVLLTGSPALAASFAPTTIKVSVDPAFWDQYHAQKPNAVNGDVEKIYKIKKVEVRLLAGDREFGFHSFTPEDKGTREFSLLYGVSSSLTIRIKSFAAEDVIWISSHPYKYTGDNIQIKAVPTSITINYPGI